MTAKTETSDELWARVETAIGYGPGRSRCLAAVRAYAEALARKRVREAGHAIDEFTVELDKLMRAAPSMDRGRQIARLVNELQEARDRILEEKSC